MAKVSKNSRTGKRAAAGSGRDHIKVIKSIKDPITERLRRLTPYELEKLNMFPGNLTEMKGVSDGKRAFFMGNALVTGVVEKIAKSLIIKLD